MWIANQWKEYKVLDTSGGEKLENWNGYRLIRPDPQVIWKTEKGSEWKKPNAHYHRSSKGGGEWEFFDLPDEWTISYDLGHGEGALSPDQKSPKSEDGRKEAAPAFSHTLSFHLKPFKFKHTGLFPEQAVNWDWFSALIYKKKQERGDAPVKVLNLFAYTGGATLAAAAAGASVTHVDAAKGMVAWAKENAASSGLEKAPVRWLVDDCTKFVERELRRGNRYDAIIMDPPSYGRGPGGEVWKIEDTLYDLVVLCARLLSDEALFFLINSYTTGLAPGVMAYLLEAEVKSRFGGTVHADEIGLPVGNGSLVLPCGASGRWMKD